MADTKVAAIIFYVIIGIGGGNMPGNPLAFWWGCLAAVTVGSKKEKTEKTTGSARNRTDGLKILCLLTIDCLRCVCSSRFLLVGF